MSIIDTHLHLVYQDRFTYPWFASEPKLNQQWTVERYLAEAEALGIEAAMHMEADVVEPDIEGEARFVTSVHSKVIGAIASCRPESTGFAAQLERLVAIKGVKGLRRILHVVPDDLSASPIFAENIRRLSAHGLTFDLCLRADQLVSVGLPLIGKCPDVQFVLDHCGVPDIVNDAYAPWRDAVTEIAKAPNLVCKVSGITAYAGPNPTTATLRPYVEHVISSFGWDRVVWGSDNPVCTLESSLTQWVGMTHEFLAGTSVDEKARLLRENAKRVYRL